MATEDNLRLDDLEVAGRLVDASNASLLCTLSDQSKVIYKPIAGERPLWDFPTGNLASREVAAYLISEIGGFHLVPETILRDGPFGPGAVQRWIEVDESIDVVELALSQNESIAKMAIFDSIINNTDRKFGHILPTSESSIFGCDHGVSFHTDFKLRTVIWQWAGEPISEKLLKLILNVRNGLSKAKLEDLITSEEIDALSKRIEFLLSNKTFPFSSEEWPSVPYPPF
jgi:uncharacterized repeat protein (TIGR03843 family)